MQIEAHAAALSDYCRNKIIPRGLRVKKIPGMFPNNDKFKDRWFAILNKCSMDLMILLIETSKSETAQLDKEIKELEDKMRPSFNTSEFSTKKENLDKDIAQQLNELKLTKF